MAYALSEPYQSPPLRGQVHLHLKYGPDLVFDFSTVVTAKSSPTRVSMILNCLP